MLERIKVKNVALIDESEIELEGGLNILTGETGAGKSILIDSIHLALGAKANKSLIRTGCDHAYVELCFHVEQEEIRERLREMEIYPDEDGRVCLQRRIMETKSSCRMNGETVSGKLLKEAASVLIDIHGQHEHQSLLIQRKHLEILDAFGQDALFAQKEKLAKLYTEYKELERKEQEANAQEENRDRELSLARFEIKEIEEADLKEAEDEELEKEFRRMENVKTIGEQLSAAAACIDSYDGQSAAALVSAAVKSLSQARQYDDSLQTPFDNLMQVEELLRDTGRELSRHLESLELDPERYAYVRERLDTINRLKDKYGKSIEDILSYAEEKQTFLDKFENFEQYKQKLTQEKEQKYAELSELCGALSKRRQKEARQLEKEMQNALTELNFQHVSFVIELLHGQEYLSRSGMDEVRFLISLNVGEQPKPLAEVASGGELSRIMLALKSVMADRDDTETLIFDEIDAGISGITAWKVSQKLAILGKRHQVICITHLPQIAAMADQHFLIEKSQSGEATTTAIRRLDEEGMLGELGRLLGSDILTQAAYTNAKELRQQAREVKKQIGSD